MLLDFSNILSKSAIERLAQVDEYEVVREVQVRLLLLLFDCIYLELCLAGIFRGLCAYSTLSFLAEPYTISIKTTVWFDDQLMGLQSA